MARGRSCVGLTPRNIGCVSLLPMAIITKDILLTGIRRDDVFEWMGDPTNTTSSWRAPSTP